MAWTPVKKLALGETEYVYLAELFYTHKLFLSYKCIMIIVILVISKLFSSLFDMIIKIFSILCPQI